MLVYNCRSNSSPKLPPIFRQRAGSNVIVKSLIKLVANNNFHIVPLRKGDVHETKIVCYTEDYYRKIAKYLSEKNQNFYTYQLTINKGLQVVIKGIDADEEPKEIKDDLEEYGYTTKNVTNIFNKTKVPQPMLRVDLVPITSKLKQVKKE